MKIAVELGRAVKPGLLIGVCGEHGGESESIEFYHLVGLNFVSCSPFRVPVARLAAAQARLKNKVDEKHGFGYLKVAVYNQINLKQGGCQMASLIIIEDLDHSKKLIATKFLVTQSRIL
ncbi:MAG: Pyruvate, phosphate dikinase [Pelotomaculum sp. PtaB.Bin117]|nr:MAG: Pyruvate, phosphate dikinase [Pelotomaculum sp. PtaB.Bin117]